MTQRASEERQPQHRVQQRLERVRAALRQQGVDLLAVPPGENMRYLLGFSPTRDERPCFVLVPAVDRKLGLLVPSLNREQMMAAIAANAGPAGDSGATAGLVVESYTDAEGPAEALARLRRRLGFEGIECLAVDNTTRADFLLPLQRAFPAREVDLADPLIAPLRMVKDASEQRLLEASAALADEAMRAAVAAVRPGATEAEVAAAAAAAFYRGGAEEVLFTQVASGPNGAYPHHHTSTRVIQAGDPVTIDIGARLNGYCSDITRVAVAGGAAAGAGNSDSGADADEGPSAEPGVVSGAEAFSGAADTEFGRVWAAVDAAVRAAMAAARPGATLAEVDRAARSTLEAAGYGEFFVHRTGHGVGLSIHEEPSVHGANQTVIREGMVFTIEPGIYLPGRFGVRLEEVVIVGREGCRKLSGLGRGVGAR